MYQDMLAKIVQSLHDGNVIFILRLGKTFARLGSQCILLFICAFILVEAP